MSHRLEIVSESGEESRLFLNWNSSFAVTFVVWETYDSGVLFEKLTCSSISTNTAMIPTNLTRYYTKSLSQFSGLVYHSYVNEKYHAICDGISFFHSCMPPRTFGTQNQCSASAVVDNYRLRAVNFLIPRFTLTDQ